MTLPGSYVPTDIIIPEDDQELRYMLNDTLHRIIDCLNDKDIAHYNIIEEVNGQKWYDGNNPSHFYNVFRKVIELGGLNDFTAVNPQNTAHGINITADMNITRIYGVATDPSTIYIPLPYIDMTGGGNHIQLSMDATNIVLRSNFDYSGFINANVIVEWVYLN